ncbi:hypothetical protein [Salinarimonas sp.]|uniref:hypothetical protein n=1 Tax=Salinarimonas sp. TaxID=2766526 RepID=UPI00391A3181
MKFKQAMLAAIMAVASTSPTLAEVDFSEAWHACDDAAVERGFVEASLPDRSLGYSQEAVIRQVAGPFEGQDLITIAMPTSTGTVFCQLTTDLRVVLYKFNGREVIGASPKR